MDDKQRPNKNNVDDKQRPSKNYSKILQLCDTDINCE